MCARQLFIQLINRVEDLSNGQHRFKVDVNAKENHMSGEWICNVGFGGFRVPLQPVQCLYIDCSVHTVVHFQTIFISNEILCSSDCQHPPQAVHTRTVANTHRPHTCLNTSQA